MQVVVVRSPGLGASPHWSAGFADQLERLVKALGGTVRQLLPRVARQGMLSPSAIATVNRDLQLDCDLTAALRE